MDGEGAKKLIYPKSRRKAVISRFLITVKLKNLVLILISKNPALEKSLETFGSRE